MPKERDLQRAVLTYLQYQENLGRVYFFRNNSFAGYVTRPGQKKPSYIKNNKPGMPDIVVCYQGRFIGLELKGTKGKQSEEQKEAERVIHTAGGEYYVIRDLEEVISLLT